MVGSVSDRNFTSDTQGYSFPFGDFMKRYGGSNAPDFKSVLSDSQTTQGIVSDLFASSGKLNSFEDIASALILARLLGLSRPEEENEAKPSEKTVTTFEGEALRSNVNSRDGEITLDASDGGVGIGDDEIGDELLVFNKGGDGARVSLVDNYTGEEAVIEVHRKDGTVDTIKVDGDGDGNQDVPIEGEFTKLIFKGGEGRGDNGDSDFSVGGISVDNLKEAENEDSPLDALRQELNEALFSKVLREMLTGEDSEDRLAGLSPIDLYYLLETARWVQDPDSLGGDRITADEMAMIKNVLKV